MFSPLSFSLSFCCLCKKLRNLQHPSLSTDTICLTLSKSTCRQELQVMILIISYFCTHREWLWYRTALGAQGGAPGGCCGVRARARVLLSLVLIILAILSPHSLHHQDTPSMPWCYIGIPALNPPNLTNKSRCSSALIDSCAIQRSCHHWSWCFPISGRQSSVQTEDSLWDQTA